MIAPRKRWKLITLGRVMVLSVALNLQLLQQSLAQPRNRSEQLSVCMRTCQEKGNVEVENCAVPDRDKDKEDDLDGSQRRMKVGVKPSATLAKNVTRWPGEDEAMDTLPCNGAIGGGELAKTPSPGRKKQPIEHEDNMCYNKVDGDGYFVDEIDGKVIFRQLNTDLMRQDTFVKNVDYTVGKKLGKGGNGQVYEVFILSDRSKKVVVKRTTYRIKKEDVEVYKLLGDHNHIVKHLGGTFSKNGHACIFMEQCDDSLYNYMKNTLKRRLSLAEAMFYWLQIREAVEYLHDRGIIHKDIKSENVLIMMKGRRVLLCDFDSAKMLRNDLTEKGLELLGTDGFISPEVLAHESHGRPADIFNMGCWLIEMTIGSPDNNSLRGKIEKLREQDCELAELVEACVSERPEDRPTARSLLDWPVVKRYIAAGEGEVGRSQDQETSAPEDQTRALHALEYRAGESGLNEEL